MSDSRAAPRVRATLAAAALVCAGIAVVFQVVGVPLLDALALSVLLALMPALAVAQIRMLETVDIERMSAYVSSVGTLILIGGGAWAVGGREAGSGLGLVPLSSTSLLVWSVGLTLGGLAVLGVFWRLALAFRIPEHPILRALLPRSRGERVAFAGLSLAAGFGEELAYRGFAIGALAPLTGPVLAALVTSAVFGVLHVYQGPLGIVRAGVLGGLLAWGFLASGSLWPPIVAHVALDVIAGIFLADRLMVPEEVGGVRTTEPTFGDV